jgi:hypothetical protein
MRYRLVVRVTAADIGQRVAIRWRPPELDGSTLMTDVLGILEEADDHFSRSAAAATGSLLSSRAPARSPGKSYHQRRRHAGHANPPNPPDTAPLLGDSLAVLSA